MFFLRSVMLLIFGFGVGTLGTMIGVGGGWLHVPFLLLLFAFSPQLAIGTSIGIIFLNTLSGSIVYYTQKRMDWEMARRLAPAVIPGALFGPFVVQKFTNSAFFISFSVVLVLIAICLFFKRTERDAAPRLLTAPGLLHASDSMAQRYRIGIIGSLIIGFVSNIFGIGGGVIHVPFLILVLGVPTHLALGTSHFILCISSFVGVIVYFLMGCVQIEFMMPIAAGTILGAPIGAELARRVDESLIRRMLVFLLLLLALRMAYTGIQHQVGEVPMVEHVPGHQYIFTPMPTATR